MMPPMADPPPRVAGAGGRPGYDLDRLLAVAVGVFNERGYDGTSMEDLAGALGISKSSIYHHVSGKTELLRLAVDRALDALAAVTEEPRATHGPAIDRLEHLLRRSVEVLVDELPYVTLLLRVRGNTMVERQAMARRRELDHHLSDLVHQASLEGSLRVDVDPALTSRLVFGTVNSLIEWYRPARGPSVEVLSEAVLALVLHGLRTPEEPPNGKHP
jgi:AcrR family transcriptional regulator